MRARVLLVLALVLGAGCAALPAAAGDQPVWVWPVAGPVVRPFAPPATRYGAGHRGADLAGAVGTPVRAAGAGRVSYAGLLAGRGVVVVVHGALRTTYEPVTASVRVGDLVPAGAVLGRLAAGGHCSGGCLHWGLLRGDVYLDPVLLVGRGPSRLLPVGPGDVGPVAGGAVPALAPAAPSGPPAAVRPASTPRLTLRAADLPWGAAALIALVTGLLLLRSRSAPPPRRPPESPASFVPVPVDSDLVDLAAERSRRRIA